MRHRERATIDWPLTLGLIGLALFSLYAAAHVTLNLFALEDWWWAALGGMAFVAGEVVSFVTIVFAQGDKLQRTVALGGYAVFFAFSGFMQSQYFGAKIPQSPLILGWWTAVCGLFLAFEVALSLRGHQARDEERQTEDREWERTMSIKQVELDAETERVRIAEQEVTRRVQAKERAETRRTRLAAQTPTVMHKGASINERQMDLRKAVQAQPRSSINQAFAVAHGFTVSAATLRRDLNNMGYRKVNGAWTEP